MQIVFNPFTGKFDFLGITTAVVYTETPTGTVDGSNTTYTTVNTITTVIALWINGEYVHPSEYTASGAGFTMGTALPADLSGKSFTIIYV